MRTQKFTSVPTRRAKRPDGRLLREMRKRHGGSRRGGRAVTLVGLVILVVVVALAWYWLR
jgi:hypothetical protein